MYYSCLRTVRRCHWCGGVVPVWPGEVCGQRAHTHRGVFRREGTGEGVWKKNSLWPAGYIFAHVAICRTGCWSARVRCIHVMCALLCTHSSSPAVAAAAAAVPPIQVSPACSLPGVVHVCAAYLAPGAGVGHMLHAACSLHRVMHMHAAYLGLGLGLGSCTCMQPDCHACSLPSAEGVGRAYAACSMQPA